MDVSTAIRMKRAVRQYNEEPLPEDAVLAILNAGRRAQSSKNSQPWHFIAIRDKNQLKRRFGMRQLGRAFGWRSPGGGYSHA